MYQQASKDGCCSRHVGIGRSDIACISRALPPYHDWWEYTAHEWDHRASQQQIQLTHVVARSACHRLATPHLGLGRVRSRNREPYCWGRWGWSHPECIPHRLQKKIHFLSGCKTKISRIVHPRPLKSYQTTRRPKILCPDRGSSACWGNVPQRCQLLAWQGCSDCHPLHSFFQRLTCYVLDYRWRCAVELPETQLPGFSWRSTEV